MGCPAPRKGWYTTMTFTLRPWRAADAPSIAALADNPRIAANLRDVFPSPYTLVDAEAYVALCMAGDPSRELTRAIEVDGRAVGSIGVFRQTDVYRRSAELGYWLGEPYWGQGIMTGAVQAICREAFACYDIVRIYAEPFAHNTGSRRVLEKAGFILEGTFRQSIYKNGTFADSCMYARLRA